MQAALVYPHQLFYESEFITNHSTFYLIEDPLFFTQYNFHKQKLILHRASMKAYEAMLKGNGKTVLYVEAHQLADTSDIDKILIKDKVKKVSFFSLEDDWLTRRLTKALLSCGIVYNEISHPHFLTTTEKIESYTPKGSFFFFNDFYISQRKETKILMNGPKPEGGKWSFDKENRSKLPPKILIPQLLMPEEDMIRKEAVSYVNERFKDNPGFGGKLLFPSTRAQALDWCESFFRERFYDFGPYEDAIERDEHFLFHSVFTSFLNIGLVSPNEILLSAIKHDVPLNSKEGFIRQILGWREFIRLVYRRIGSIQRTTNFLQNIHPMPACFYDGTSGVEPVDCVIKRLLSTGYTHHIERLMVLGNFFLLCDVHPDEVYKWFMELYIDSYDWVMVPNVYGMSQYADGGLMTTKPYVSGSSYILRMSNFKKGPWCEIWDGLYWRFIDKHKLMIAENPRMSIMVGMRDKLAKTKQLSKHIRTAENFLSRIYS